MIKLENINLAAGNFSLKNLSMHIKQGEFNLLLGPTGSGKTMLLESIAGLNNPSSGNLFINSEDTFKLPPEERNISYLPQDNALFPHMTVFKNISFGLELKNQAPDLIKNKVEEIAYELCITHLLDRKIHKLSGGEQQRVALARALVLDNHILLLDEPTSALHETMQEDFSLMLKDLHKKFKLTVLMTTHYKDCAFLLADKIHFIDNGELLLSASTKDIYKIPLPRKVAELLGIKNFINLNKIREEENNNIFKCDKLNCELKFSKSFGDKNSELILGIKPEDIRIIRDEDMDKTQFNDFDALVGNILFKENDALVVLKIPQTEATLKMQLPIYVLKKMKITEGMLIRCKIKEEYVRTIY